MKKALLLILCPTISSSIRQLKRWASGTVHFGARLSITGFALMPEESKLTNKQRLFLDALISEEAMGDLRTAMSLAGYSDNTKVAHTAKELRDEIREATETLLAMYAPKAAYALISVLDNPDALNARHVISAAKEILDRTGLVKKERVEVTGNTGGIFILPPKASNNDEI